MSWTTVRHTDRTAKEFVVYFKVLEGENVIGQSIIENTASLSIELSLLSNHVFLFEIWVTILIFFIE